MAGSFWDAAFVSWLTVTVGGATDVPSSGLERTKVGVIPGVGTGVAGSLFRSATSSPKSGGRINAPRVENIGAVVSRRDRGPGLVAAADAGNAVAVNRRPNTTSTNAETCLMPFPQLPRRASANLTLSLRGPRPRSRWDPRARTQDPQTSYPALVVMHLGNEKRVRDGSAVRPYVVGARSTDRCRPRWPLYVSIRRTSSRISGVSPRPRASRRRASSVPSTASSTRRASFVPRVLIVSSSWRVIVPPARGLRPDI